MCQTLSLPPGGRQLPANIRMPGKTGIADVIKDRLILFQQLKQIFWKFFLICFIKVSGFVLLVFTGLQFQVSMILLIR